MAQGINHFTSRNTPIERLNPVVKVAAVFALGLSALIWPTPWLGLAFVVVLFPIAAVARIGGSFAKIMIGFGIPITVMLMFIQGLYSPRNRTVIADLGFAQLGLEGVLYAAKIIVVVLTFLGSFTIMTKTTATSRLMAALNGIGLNAKIGYLVLASLNVVPQMQRRMAVIQEAQSARGLEIGGSMVSRLKAALPLLGPVVMSSLTDAQERGMTLETRGFGIRGVRRTTYIQVDWRRCDRVALAVLAIGFTAAVIVSVLAYAGVVVLPGGVR